MSRDASVTLDWADGTYQFRMAWGQLEELQEVCEAGPFIVLNRLLGGQWKVQDIANVIRLGLIGGGMEPAKALKLVRSYVQDRPPMESLTIAQRVLGVGVIGAVDEADVGKKSGAASPDGELSPNSPMESSDLPPSTATAP